ncbi:MAG TPA: ribonuclease P protein component [Gemmatimonadales bacterium]|nr:ribonuclease P protein component [Gemmatimonadales bacterium]
MEWLTAERYPPRARLPRGADLVQCWESGRRVRMRHLEMAWRPNSQGHARTGIVVPRFGETAVARNRLRRRVREILRRELLASLPAVDMVVRARRAAYTARFADLRAELADAAARIG